MMHLDNFKIITNDIEIHYSEDTDLIGVDIDNDVLIEFGKD